MGTRNAEVGTRNGGRMRGPVLTDYQRAVVVDGILDDVETPFKVRRPDGTVRAAPTAFDAEAVTADAHRTLASLVGVAYRAYIVLGRALHTVNMARDGLQTGHAQAQALGELSASVDEVRQRFASVMGLVPAPAFDQWNSQVDAALARQTADALLSLGKRTAPKDGPHCADCGAALDTATADGRCPACSMCVAGALA